MIKEKPIEKVAEYLIAIFVGSGTEISHLKLQKILYYTQGWHLVYFHMKPLFSDVPQAWVNGPVYPKIYEKYKTIDSLNDTIPKKLPIEEYFNKLNEEINFASQQQELIYAIINKYGSMNAGELVSRTHRELPWNKARKGIPPFSPSTNEISHKSMYEYFKSLVTKE